MPQANDHFQPPNLALTTIGLALATFMFVLDTTIANVSIPTIAGNMSVSVDQGTWVVTSFAVSQAIGLPLTGFLARRLGEVRIFVWSTALFVTASFACGLATNMSMLVFFRVIQGAMCGPMYPVTQSLMIAIYPARKRGMALAFISMVTVVAPVVGPILGGWITDSFSWRWIFFINVPIGFFCSFTIRNQLKNKPEFLSKPRMDYVGLVTLVIGAGLLQVVLDKGNDVDWFSSTFIDVAAILAVIAIAVFIIWELTDKDPIVDLKLFRHRNFAAGTLVFTLGYAAFFGGNLLIPLWLQNNLGYTAIWAGLATAPVGVLPIILVYFTGRYAHLVDMRILASISFGAMSAVAFLYSGLNLSVAYHQIAFIEFLLGLGVAFFFMPVLTILLSDLKASEITSGSGLATFMRTMGGSFAASIMTFVWTRRASFHHARLTDNITGFNPNATDALHRFGPDHPTLSLLHINGIITQQGFQMSFNDVFYATGWIMLALVFITWLARPPFIEGGK